MTKDNKDKNISKTKAQYDEVDYKMLGQNAKANHQQNRFGYIGECS